MISYLEFVADLSLIEVSRGELGIWQVTYNGENRPILWSNGVTNIVMSYDRMGRRVVKNDHRFVYSGYLQIADNNGNAYVWDPTEAVATRPLVWNRSGTSSFYTHDGNKNVSEVVLSNGTTEAHYECAPFGALVAHSGDSAMENHWRYSSEYADDMLGLVYYNYRHYELVMGRWLSRDPINERGGKNLYVFCSNSPTRSYDAFGETDVTSDAPFPGAYQVGNKWWLYVDDGQNGTVTLIRKDLSYLIEQMEIAAKRLCRYARDEGKRSRDHEGYFDTDFFAGEGVQHQYYLIEGQSRIWADNEVNYIGIGMYEAWIGDNIISAHAIVYAYKAFKWHTLPTEGTFYWLDIGYRLFDSFYSGLDPCTCEYKKDEADSGRPDNRRNPGRPGNRGGR